MEEFHDFMKKVGIVAEEEDGKDLSRVLLDLLNAWSNSRLCHTNCPGTKKIKLYYNEHGEPKGDGRCTYLKVESVQLALQILDETEIRPGFTVHIERVCGEASQHSTNTFLIDILTKFPFSSSQAKFKAPPEGAAAVAKIAKRDDKKKGPKKKSAAEKSVFSLLLRMPMKPRVFARQLPN